MFSGFESCSSDILRVASFLVSFMNKKLHMSLEHVSHSKSKNMLDKLMVSIGIRECSTWYHVFCCLSCLHVEAWKHWSWEVNNSTLTPLTLERYLETYSQCQQVLQTTTAFTVVELVFKVPVVDPHLT